MLTLLTQNPEPAHIIDIQHLTYSAKYVIIIDSGEVFSPTHQGVKMSTEFTFNDTVVGVRFSQGRENRTGCQMEFTSQEWEGFRTQSGFVCGDDGTRFWSMTCWMQEMQETTEVMWDSMERHHTAVSQMNVMMETDSEEMCEMHRMCRDQEAQRVREMMCS